MTSTGTSERGVVRIRRALVSVSDKSGLPELAAALAAAGVELVSTGSTAKLIAAEGHPVVEVASVTGFPESLDGRVKTLHPAIHAGILADLRRDSHAKELELLDIAAFELVVVNLYPFVETVASGAAPAEVIEQIDIGGPAMVRSAAKNHANVAVVVDPKNYPSVVKSLAVGGTTLLQRERFAAEAFAHTAAYDAAVADYFAENLGVRSSRPRVSEMTELTAESPTASEEGRLAAADSPSFLAREGGMLRVSARGEQPLRYGENSHQSAWLYRAGAGAGLAAATLHGGKEMSYNNFVDADAAVRAAFDHDEPAVAIIKHANPCGIAVADTIARAHAAAHACDPVSAYGGVVAANRAIDGEAAESIAPIFTEVVIAPSFTDDALEVFAAKKNLRVLELPAGFAREELELRQISGGVLVQSPDRAFAPFADWRLVAGDAVDEPTRADLEFAWRAVRAVKSNAILLARGRASVGIGMGQVNRVDSCRLAVARAEGRDRGSVAASDAFFPFADGLQILLDAGVRAVVQPGGSIRDDEVIAAAQDAGVSMYFTGERHFFH